MEPIGDRICHKEPDNGLQDSFRELTIPNVTNTVDCDFCENVST